MQINNLTRTTTLASQVCVADHWQQRLLGWLGRSAPLPEDALYLTPCHGVHSLGMKFGVDAVYISRQGVVLGVYTLAPWRCGPLLLACQGVLELPAKAGCVPGCAKGDQLQWVGRNGW